MISRSRRHTPPSSASSVFWALTQGQTSQYTAKLLFVPLPKPVLVASEKTLKQVHS